MDFKVAGPENMVTALQLDTKISGVPAQVLRDALMAAKKARLHIIEKMNECLPEPRLELAPLAPRVLAMKVPVDKIGEVIGPKGKNINMITQTTGVEIDIEDDGTIRIGSTDQESAEKAASIIDEIGEPTDPRDQRAHQRHGGQDHDLRRVRQHLARTRRPGSHQQARRGPDRPRRGRGQGRRDDRGRSHGHR